MTRSNEIDKDKNIEDIARISTAHGEKEKIMDSSLPIEFVVAQNDCTGATIKMYKDTCKCMEVEVQEC